LQRHERSVALQAPGFVVARQVSAHEGMLCLGASGVTDPAVTEEITKADRMKE